MPAAIEDVLATLHHDIDLFCRLTAQSGGLDRKYVYTVEIMAEALKAVACKPCPLEPSRKAGATSLKHTHDTAGCNRPERHTRSTSCLDTFTSLDGRDLPEQSANGRSDSLSVTDAVERLTTLTNSTNVLDDTASQPVKVASSQWRTESPLTPPPSLSPPESGFDSSSLFHQSNVGSLSQATRSAGSDTQAKQKKPYVHEISSASVSQSGRPEEAGSTRKRDCQCIAEDTDGIERPRKSNVSSGSKQKHAGPTSLPDKGHGSIRPRTNDRTDKISTLANAFGQNEEWNNLDRSIARLKAGGFATGTWNMPEYITFFKRGPAQLLMACRGFRSYFGGLAHADRVEPILRRIVLADFYHTYRSALEDPNGFLEATKDELRGKGYSKATRGASQVKERCIDLIFNEPPETERQYFRRLVNEYQGDGGDWLRLIERFGIGILFLVPRTLTNTKCVSCGWVLVILGNH